MSRTAIPFVAFIRVGTILTHLSPSCQLFQAAGNTPRTYFSNWSLDLCCWGCVGSSDKNRTFYGLRRIGNAPLAFSRAPTKTS